MIENTGFQLHKAFDSKRNVVLNNKGEQTFVWHWLRTSPTVLYTNKSRNYQSS